MKVTRVPARSGAVIVHPPGCDCLEVERASVAAFVEKCRAEAATARGGDHPRIEFAPVDGGASEYARLIRSLRAARRADDLMRRSVGR